MKFFGMPHLCMNIQKLFFAPPVAAFFLMAAALILPCSTQAVSIGEITLQSRLGEPLRAQVSLTVDNGERIDDACLSLLAPNPNTDSTGYLTRAELTIKTEGARQYIAIVSHKQFNDAFARLWLQIKCPGMGSISKTLTVLPDLGEPAPQTPITAPAVPASTQDTLSQPAQETPANAPASNLGDTKTSSPPVKKHDTSRKAPAARKQHPSSAQRVDKKTERTGYFRLKLSGDPIDESRIGKISPEERAFLLERQKLLDADDQTASFLALQNQVKLLQDELGAIKSQLAQLGAASSIAPVVTASATADMPEQRKPAIAAKPPVIQQSNSTLQNGLFAALGILSILALWQGLRHYTRVKSRIEIKPQQDAEPLIKPADDVATPAAPVTPSPSQPATGTPLNAALPQKIAPTVSEEDSMLEEAGLYAAHGHQAKAAEILRDIVGRYPAKVEAWTLLLSLYASLRKTSEFEKAAREFLMHHRDDPSWPGIQTQGRALDKNNPLYADDDSKLSPPPSLQQSTSPEEATEIRPAADLPAANEVHALDFVLDSSPAKNTLDLEFDIPTEKDKPLDFEVAPSASATTDFISQEESIDFPEIQLDFGSDEQSGEEKGKQ